MAARKTSTLRRDNGHRTPEPNPDVFDGPEPTSCPECQGHRVWAILGGVPEETCLSCVRYLPSEDRLPMRMLATPKAHLDAVWDTLARAEAAVGDLLADRAPELTAPDARYPITGRDLVWIRMNLSMMMETLEHRMVYELDRGWDGAVVRPDPHPAFEVTWLRPRVDVPAVVTTSARG